VGARDGTPYLSRMSSASISARGITGTCFSRAAMTRHCPSSPPRDHDDVGRRDVLRPVADLDLAAKLAEPPVVSDSRRSEPETL